MQQAVLAALPTALGPDRPAVALRSTVAAVSSRMRPLLRAVVETCGILSSPRELRDLFGWLADIADTLRAMGLSPPDAAALLSCLTRCLPGQQAAGSTPPAPPAEPPEPPAPPSRWSAIATVLSLQSSAESAPAEAGQAEAWQRFLDGATPVILRLLVV